MDCLRINWVIGLLFGLCCVAGSGHFGEESQWR